MYNMVTDVSLYKIQQHFLWTMDCHEWKNGKECQGTRMSIVRSVDLVNA